MSCKIFVVLAVSILTLSLTACGNTAEEEAEISPLETLEVTGDYVGMSVSQAQAQAQARNVPFRIVMADGEVFAVTMDYRPGRINATVENGVVVSYEVEGQEAAEKKL